MNKDHMIEADSYSSHILPPFCLCTSGLLLTRSFVGFRLQEMLSEGKKTKKLKIVLFSLTRHLFVGKLALVL
jgi:hypothetical protein